jgi:hypothetical protein
MTVGWSETVRLGEVSRLGKGARIERRFALDAAARADLASLLDLESLESLEGTLRVASWFDGARIDGRWTAAVTQLCGISLEPLNSNLAGHFVVHVVPEGSDLAPQADGPEMVIEADDDDPPDVLEGEVIDLGGYVIEHLALEIDPFPRAPGVEFEPPAPDPEASPFAKLAALKVGKDQP